MVDGSIWNNEPANWHVSESCSPAFRGQNRWHTHRLSRAMARVHNGCRPVPQRCCGGAPVS